MSRLVEGTTEYRILLDYVINQFSKTPVNKCKPVIRMILRMGVYQILFMDRVPKEAVCNESVKMALFESYERRIDKINAVLNSYGISSIEEAEKITKDAGLDVYDQVKKIQPI